jgi:hypothetical protein
MKSFAVNWDYRCPFARNAHEHVVTALADGAEWDVTFLPFSLTQTHIPEGGTPVWDDPTKEADLIALAAGVVVRDRYPDQFFAVHEALFAARHDQGVDLRVAQAVSDVLDANGVPGDDVLREIKEGWPIAVIRDAHLQAINEWEAFGVPTFVVDDRAVFVSLMSRPEGDAALARRTIGGILDLFDAQPDLNEFKYTTLKR